MSGEIFNPLSTNGSRAGSVGVKHAAPSSVYSLLRGGGKQRCVLCSAWLEVSLRAPCVLTNR